MARVFLAIYVLLNIFIVIINLIVNIFGDETIHVLSSEDWLTFMVACGALGICETLEKYK